MYRILYYHNDLIKGNNYMYFSPDKSDNVTYICEKCSQTLKFPILLRKLLDLSNNPYQEALITVSGLVSSPLSN